jgi:hypothetical protein
VGEDEAEPDTYRQAHHQDLYLCRFIHLYFVAYPFYYRVQYSGEESQAKRTPGAPTDVLGLRRFGKLVS